MRTGGGNWGGKQGMWEAYSTGTGSSNAYFVASLNGGPPEARVSFWVARAPWPPVELSIEP